MYGINPIPVISGTSYMIAKVIIKDGYTPETGLGENAQGMTRPLSLLLNERKFGLGFEPTHWDMRNQVLKRRKKILSQAGGHVKEQKMVIPKLSDTFISGGLTPTSEENAFIITVIKSLAGLSIQAILEEDSGNVELVRPCSKCEALDNWEITKLPAITKSSMK